MIKQRKNKVTMNKIDLFYVINSLSMTNTSDNKDNYGQFN